jgi:ABC-type transport system involved in cytochrome bd biosynthesis fused ATPase/permease subunit
MKPYDPHGFHRHLIHRKETHYEGQRVPEETALYEQIAEDLKPANEIVLIGHGTGKSSALNFLLEYLKTHHSTIFPQVIAAEVADLSASTEPEIEAIAKQHL